MTSLSRKTLKVPSGNTYSYLSLGPTTTENPTLLFIHGFPATAHDWHFQFDHFSSLGYGIIAPDLLGHGRTSHPRDVNEYIGVKMAADIIYLVDHEQAENDTMTKGGKVIGIAHDWGAYLLSQLAIYHEDRFDKFVFISVAFIPPGSAFDVPALNEATEKAIGYPIFGYWLFMSDDRAGEVIAKNWETCFSILYTSDADLWKTDMAPVGSLERFIKAGKPAPTGAWITDEDKREHQEAFGGDYVGAVLWYRRGLQGLGTEAEEKLLAQGKLKEKLETKVLMISGTRDAICLAGPAKQRLAEVVKEGLWKTVDLDAGHWVMLEQAAETNRAIEEFIKE